MSKLEKIIAIIAVVQICKYYGAPSKLLPILAMIVGAILEFSDNPTGNGILDGILLGAIVTGGYGVIKGVGQALFGRFKKHISTDELEADDDRINY